MKRIAVSLLFFTIAVSLHAQVWTWQHPKPQGNNLNGVAFYTDTKNGYAVGDNGTILKTTDGGTTWVAQNSGTNNDLLTVCVSLSTPLDAVAAGTNDTYTYTTNGGATWTPATVSVVGSTITWRGSFYYYVNDQVFLCGDDGYIIKSTDNGATFSTLLRTGSLNGYISNQHKTNDTLYSIAFYYSSLLSSGYGIAVGSNSEVCVTSNGGNTWQDTSFPAPGMLLTGVGVPNVTGYYDGVVAGYNAQGSGGVWHTANYGYTWAQTPTAPNNAYTAVGFAGNADGPIYAVSQQGYVAYGLTSGGIWNTDAYFNTNTTQLNAVNWPTGNFGCIVGNAGKIFVKSGVSGWVERDSGGSAPLQDIAFTDTKTGYACGDGGAVIVTTNGGVQWKDTKINGVDTLLSISFADGKHGYTAGENGQIYYTANGGASWQSQQSGVSANITCIRYIDTLTAWACSAGGDLLMTQNAPHGAWNAAQSPTAKPLAKLFFLNGNIGWLLAQQDSAYRTLDGGATWQSEGVTADQTITLKSIWFSDILHGWAAGTKGFVAQTTNGGATWSQINSTSFTPQLSNTASVNAVGFIDAQNGWIAGSGGTVYFTSDSGTTWHAQASNTVNDLFGLDMVDIGDGWTAGNNGAILKFSNAGSSISSVRVVDFGKVAFGLSKDTAIALRNSDGSPISIADINVYRAVPVDQSGVDGQFVLTNQRIQPTVISPNGVDSLYLTFQPQPATGGSSSPRYRASVTDIAAQTGALEGAITLVGNGAYSSIAIIKPASGKIDFQSVFLTHCREDSVIIQNTGEIPVTLSEIFGNVDGQPNAAFSVLDPNVTIAPGATGTVHLLYCPTQLRVDTCTLTIGGVPNSVAIKLTGQGVKVVLSVTPKRLEMNFCSTGDTTISVKNIGNTQWTVINPITRALDAFLVVTNISFAGGCSQGSTLPPPPLPDSCNFQLQLTDPKAPPATKDSTWLVFTDQVGDPLDSIFIVWSDISTSLNNQDAIFKCIPVNTRDSVLVTLSNAGDTIFLDSVTIRGVNGGAYSWSPVYPPGLDTLVPAHRPYKIPPANNPNDSIVVWFIFHPGPSDTGNQSNAQIVCYYPLCAGGPDVADTNTHADSACATRAGFVITPGCLDFGTDLQIPKQTPDTLFDTLTFNNNGTAPDTIKIVSGPATVSYSFTPSQFILPANQSLNIDTAIFHPTGAGCVPDTIIFSDGRETQKVCLYACAFTQGLYWTPTPISYGNVLVGDTSCVTGYIKNTGSDSISVLSMQGSSPAFAITIVGGSLPYIIPPGDSVFVRFCYIPQQIGNDTLTVTFTTSMGVSAIFKLQGSGYSIGQTC
ncbi:MAG TPA: YCF48-related protein, partial [Candidatus Kapabacteria bacterium]|nr:YCF48-related protein [Candidatus Kapabacteria bacterium]